MWLLPALNIKRNVSIRRLCLLCSIIVVGSFLSFICYVFVKRMYIITKCVFRLDQSHAKSSALLAENGDEIETI